MHSRLPLLILVAVSALLAIGVTTSLSRTGVGSDLRPVAAPPAAAGECCDENRDGWCPPEGFAWQDCGKNC
jgi:hypothetical protein